MAKDYFSIQNTTSLNSLKKGDRIHVIGVCGVAMAQLAITLNEIGFSVSGSDKEFYQPMKSILSRSAVSILQGYKRENVPRDAALVVIGNSISYGNPEVTVVEELALKYTFFPKLLAEIVISGRHSIVVAGTHGKSTTSALIATLLLEDQREPSYFVGGVAQSLPHSLAVGSGAYAVVEGDEYDSAFFAKVPKFTFYDADTLVINAIEFDHADIYPNVEAIDSQFNSLVVGLKSTATAVCCIDFPRVRKLVAEWRRSAKCEILTFGCSSDADFRIVEREVSGFGQRVTVTGPGLGGCTLELPLVGEYNARNALAAIIVSQIIGMELGKTSEYLGRFKSVKRRQEMRARRGGVVLIEDFAHHPTAVAQTVDAIRESFPAARLWAVFEPRSNTSRRKVFQADYIEAFKRADSVILRDVTARDADRDLELIDVGRLSAEISASGVPARCFSSAQDIRNYLWGEIDRSQREDSPTVRDVILVMSNGGFEGLVGTLEGDLS
jgi:UDP-N-acetylmuramate: L-alanyl-gamma-D-glutamyl-meso-diaminopimelate ligase